jgi:MFS family permease
MLLNMLIMGPLYDTFQAAGVSRSFVATMFMIGTMAAAALSPLAGRAIDKFGGRVMVPVALTVMGSEWPRALNKSCPRTPV